MGHSSSSTNTNITNRIANTTDISSINKNVVESATNVLIESAATCSNAVNQNNSCSIAGAKIGSNLNLNSDQVNKASVNFSCIQSATAANQMANAMKQGIMGELNSVSNSEVAAALNAAAAAIQKSGFASTGGSSSANTDSNVSNVVTNETKVTIENIYEQNLKNNFNSKTVDECIGKTTQNNTLSAAGAVVAGEANVSCIQTNTLEAVQECKQLMEAANKTLEKTAQELQFRVVKSDTTKMSSEVKAKTSALNEDTGPIQDLGNAVSQVVGSISDLFGMASLGVAAPFVIYCCFICCCLIISMVSSLVAAKAAGDSGSLPPSLQGHYNKGKSKFGEFTKGFKGGNGNSLEFDYLANTGLNLISDILLSESSPFE